MAVIICCYNNSVYYHVAGIKGLKEDRDSYSVIKVVADQFSVDLIDSFLQFIYNTL